MLSALSLTGCFWKRHHAAPAAAVSSAQTTTPVRKEIVPLEGYVGRVASVNEGLRFVILNFPIGSVPGADLKLSVYRKEAKVGQVRVTGPRREDNTVADIEWGELQAGDEVREK